MRTELKKAIIEWLFENEKEFRRESCCVRKFRAYIYDAEGYYLIGGEEVSEFIGKADKLLNY